MEKEFISQEDSLALEELGFDVECLFHWYEGGLWMGPFKDSAGVKAILFQQAFKWFWDKHGKFVDFFVDDDKTFGFMISFFNSIGRVDMPAHYKFNSLEAAQYVALIKLIDLVKQQPWTYTQQ